MPSLQPPRPADARRHAAFAPASGGAWLQTVAALLWLPQAAAVAYALQRLADGGGLQAAWPAAVVLGGLGALRSAIDSWGMRRAFQAARLRLSDLRAEAAAALAAHSPLDKTRTASGAAASILAEQAEAILPYFSRYQPARFKAMAVPLAIVACVLPLSWVAALILICAAPLIPLFMALIGWRAKAASEAHLAELGAMNGFLLDRLRGLTTLRALGAVPRTAQRLADAACTLRERIMAVLAIAFLSSAVLELFASLGVAMMAVYVGFHLLGELGFGAWGHRLSLGQGLFILMLAPAFFDPLRELSAVWHDRASGEAALRAVARLAQASHPLPGAPDAGSEATAAPVGGRVPPAAPVRVDEAQPPAAPAIDAADLVYQYPGQPCPALSVTALRIAPGEHVALVGPSGAGKSTLLALLAGLGLPRSGRLRIGGIDAHASTAAALRAQAAWLDQRPHIFAGTLRDNITLGRHVPVAAVDQALHRASLGTLATERGDAELAEGGAGLSGGEILRLAIARAVLDTNRGLLLADEPTAHLDAATAADVARELRVLAAGRTLVVATHDPVLAAAMDRRIRIDAPPAGGSGTAATAPQRSAA